MHVMENNLIEILLEFLIHFHYHDFLVYIDQLNHFYQLKMNLFQVNI